MGNDKRDFSWVTREYLKYLLFKNLMLFTDKVIKELVQMELFVFKREIQLWCSTILI
jgi:hypothetical protein